PLTQQDALSFLDTVRDRFSSSLDIYNQFLDIMKDFKTEVIDTAEVMVRVARLFKEDTDLIHGFNTFLPAGYSIKVSSGGVKMYTPQGVVPLANP
ncbi:hypothetical protein M408DRAFT_82101, partial [Serendipita vermifera MAFF 305830]